MLPRTDLLALSVEDLAALANRGLLKRAEREVQSDPPPYTLRTQSDGTIEVVWTDGAICTLPPATPLDERLCSCAATTICRHLVGAVLAYQRQSVHPEEPAAAWDPGQIEDAQIERYFRKTALAQARQQFAAGQLIELVRGNKPMARFHTRAHTVRYPVPGDLAYARCDCAESPPCRHALLGVWAFRCLAADQTAGLVETGEPLPVPGMLLDEMEKVLVELLAVGIAGCSAALAARLRRLAAACEQAELVWPAEVVLELLQEQERYAAHDARFCATLALDCLAELCIRSDAIRSHTGAVPQRFVRGTTSDRVSDRVGVRLVGLGLGVILRPKSVRLVSYLQDADSGEVVGVLREFADTTRPFAELARTPVVKDISLAALAAGQLVTRGGKYTPERQFLPGRAPAALNPQSYEWETLVRPPGRADDFAELRAHLATLPPAPLRSRRLGTSFHILAVAGIEDVHFSTVDQAVQAVLRDTQGQSALLVHPFTSRNREGTEALLARLAQGPPRFVAGPVRVAASQVVIEPVALVFENGRRSLLQPWIDTSTADSLPDALSAAPAAPPADPLRSFLDQAWEALAELLVIGLDRADELTLRRWRALGEYGAALGLVRALSCLEQFIAALEARQHRLDWQVKQAIEPLLAFAVFIYMARQTFSSSG